MRQAHWSPRGMGWRRRLLWIVGAILVAAAPFIGAMGVTPEKVPLTEYFPVRPSASYALIQFCGSLEGTTINGMRFADPDPQGIIEARVLGEIAGGRQYFKAGSEGLYRASSREVLLKPDTRALFLPREVSVGERWEWWDGEGRIAVRLVAVRKFFLDQPGDFAVIEVTMHPGLSATFYCQRNIGPVGVSINGNSHQGACAWQCMGLSRPLLRALAER